MTPGEQIAKFLRGAVELITPAELEAKLKKGKPLRVKAGFDPTATDLHLGHTVLIQKLKQFQDLGHQVIFLIGDFTALVGDPSGQIKTRPTLTEKEVEANAKTYLDQAFKILDRKKTEVRRNSEWLGKMKPVAICELAAKYNVARMHERDDFAKRFEEGGQITILEFLYPLLQGYDSVPLRADVELGGSDQKFNLVVARDILRAYGMEPEVILTMPLLLGTDGQKKMSKSYGNAIGIAEPPREIFGKIMSITDEMMWHYYELLTEENVAEVKKQHPKEAKVGLAKILVRRFYSAKEAERAAGEFERVFGQKEKPSDIEEKRIQKSGDEMGVVDILVASGLVASKGEGRRLIAQNGVRIDDARVEAADAVLKTSRSCLIQLGKRRFLKVRFE